MQMQTSFVYSSKVSDEILIDLQSLKGQSFVTTMATTNTITINIITQIIITIIITILITIKMTIIIIK